MQMKKGKQKVGQGHWLLFTCNPYGKYGSTALCEIPESTYSRRKALRERPADFWDRNEPLYRRLRTGEKAGETEFGDTCTGLRMRYRLRSKNSQEEQLDVPGVILEVVRGPGRMQASLRHEKEYVVGLRRM